MPIFYRNPIITFQVVLTDPTRLVTGFQADTIDNIIKQLQNTVVYIPHVGPVRNGDIFTMYGQNALDVQDVYATEDEFAILKVIDNPTPPVANFEVTSTVGVLPNVAITFTDTSTNNPTEWYWDFDGNAIDSNDQNPTAIFTTAGTYTITLTASNAGGSDKKTLVIVVESGEEEPPSVPLNLVIEDFGERFVELSWNPPADEGSEPVDGYIIEYKNNGQVGLDETFQEYGTTSSTTITVEPLGSRKNYSFRVAAYSNVGSSDFTNPVSTDLPTALFPALNGSCIVLTANDVENSLDWVYTTENETEDGYITAVDGEPVLLWSYNGGAIMQNNISYQPVYRQGLINGDRVFNAVEFEGGSRLTWTDAASFESNMSHGDSTFGFEAILVMKRLEPQPSTDRQTNGLWWLTGEPVPAETNDIDVHYPEDNQVIYERFGSGVESGEPRRNIFPVPIDITQWHLYQVRARNGEYKIWINGVLHYTSTSNDIAFAPTATTPTLGVSYFWPPVDNDDETSIHAGYFQLADAVWFTPVEVDLGMETPLTEEEAEDIRDQHTNELFLYMADKYDIDLQA